MAFIADFVPESVNAREMHGNILKISRSFLLLKLTTDGLAGHLVIKKEISKNHIKHLASL